MNEAGSSASLDLRIVFMGSAELSCPSLRALAAHPAWKVIGVVTQPDRAKGRGMKAASSPVKRAALELELPVFQPESARAPAFLQQLAALKPDLIVVAAYGQILTQDLLDLPRFGCVNVHTSLLPRHRGAAPIQWAILEGDIETGVTIMKMDAGLDTGGILRTRKTPISPNDTSQTLHDRLAILGAELLIETIPGCVNGQIVPVEQPPEGATYARKIRKEDGKINWDETAEVMSQKLRAFTPWPGLFTCLPKRFNHRLLKVWSAAPAPGPSGKQGIVLSVGKQGLLVGAGNESALHIMEIQREGGRRNSVQELLAGSDIAPGDRLGGD